MMSEADEFLKEGIEADIEDMNAIIDQFIDYIRHYSKGIAEYSDLNALIHEVVQTETPEGRKVIYHEQVLPEIPLRFVAMKRVVANLIQNALRYTEGDIRITAGIDRNENVAYFSVLDEGEGIPEDDIERLFNPFTQGDTARGAEGSGLGLAIIKRIVDTHGGNVILSNLTEGGLEAKVYLPLSHQSP
jgi:two-component system osmolarity sensor histidine kinase EnvZ